MYLSNDLDVKGNGSIDGSLTLGDSLNVDGDSTITGSLTVNGDITATGSLIVSGNVTLGDSSNDDLIVNSQLKSSLIPSASSTYDLGSESKKFKSIHAVSFTGSFKANNGILSGSQITSAEQGKLSFLTNLDEANVVLNSLTTASNVQFVDIRATGNVSSSGDLTVGGTADILGNVTISGSTDISGSTTIDGDGEVTGNLVVGGSITAQNVYTEYVSASILFESGSTKLGDSQDDSTTLQEVLILQALYM